MIRLRPFTVRDTPILQQKLYPEMPAEEIRQMIAEWETDSFEGKYFEMRAIIAEDTIVGSISLAEHTKSVVSLGVEICPDERRKGYASEAMKRMMDRAGVLGYRIVLDQVRADNPSSIALHHRLGFETDGYLYRNAGGKEVLLFLYCL